MTRVFAFALLLFLTPLPAMASVRQEVLPGPVTGRVITVLDGDTVILKAQIWIGTEVETSVRIAGIDAPEIKGKCEKETSMAEAARAEIARLVAAGTVSLYDIRLEKYAGRVLARVRTASGIDISDYMIAKGFVRPYGGEKRKSWCGQA